MVELTGALERDDAVIRYHDSGGTGEPVVFLHGAGMDHTSFAAQAEAVRDAGYRSVLVDQRGHGRSELADGARFRAEDALADLGALCDELRLDRPVLVGHSMGGNLSQSFVRAHPAQAGGLIVVGATWNAGPLTRAERVQLRMAMPALRMIPASKLAVLSAKASAVSVAAVEGIREVFARMPKEVFLDVMRATASFVEPDPSYRTPVPLGLVVGAEDRTGNIVTAMRAWAAADGVRLRDIPGAGHVAMADAPDAVSAAILDILREWEAPRLPDFYKW